MRLQATPRTPRPEFTNPLTSRCAAPCDTAPDLASALLLLGSITATAMRHLCANLFADTASVSPARPPASPFSPPGRAPPRRPDIASTDGRSDNPLHRKAAGAHHPISSRARDE